MMQITPEQFQLLAPCLPKQRGNVSVSNLQLLNAILYVAEQGCKWRALPAHFGNWHTIYTRMNRWAKRGVWDRVFEQMQRLRIARITLEAGSLDSTSIKVHPDAAYSDAIRPPIPGASDHSFRRHSTTHSERIRPLIPA